MAQNHKLTGVIKGLTVNEVANSDGAVSLTFNNGSVAKIKTGSGAEQSSASSITAKGKTISGVRQSGAVMNLDFTDKSSAQINLAEATSSVMVRDKSGTMVYAD